MIWKGLLQGEAELTHSSETRSKSKVSGVLEGGENMQEGGVSLRGQLGQFWIVLLVFASGYSELANVDQHIYSTTSRILIETFGKIEHF